MIGGGNRDVWPFVHEVKVLIMLEPSLSELVRVEVAIDELVMGDVVHCSANKLRGILVHAGQLCLLEVVIILLESLPDEAHDFDPLHFREGTYARLDENDADLVLLGK